VRRYDGVAGTRALSHPFGPGFVEAVHPTPPPGVVSRGGGGGFWVGLVCDCADYRVVLLTPVWQPF